jgi:hypothetical protein
LPNGSGVGDEEHELPLYLQRPLPMTGPNSPRNLEREQERKRVERQQEHAQQVRPFFVVVVEVDVTLLLLLLSDVVIAWG